MPRSDNSLENCREVTTWLTEALAMAAATLSLPAVQLRWTTALPLN